MTRDSIVWDLFDRKLPDNWPDNDLPLYLGEVDKLYNDLTGNYLPGNRSKMIERMESEGGSEVCKKIVIAMAHRAIRTYEEKMGSYPDFKEEYQSKINNLNDIINVANTL